MRLHSGLFGHRVLETLEAGACKWRSVQWQPPWLDFSIGLCVSQHYDNCSNNDVIMSIPIHGISKVWVHPRLLLHTILRSSPRAVFTFGLVCSTWVSVSRGSTYRHFFLPLGDQNAGSVQLGNLLASRRSKLNKNVFQFKNNSWSNMLRICCLWSAQNWESVFLMNPWTPKTMFKKNIYIYIFEFNIHKTNFVSWVLLGISKFVIVTYIIYSV